jgi:hypothetical protein
MREASGTSVPEESKKELYLDLSEFKLEPHVRAAVKVALLLADVGPLNARHLLTSALVVETSPSPAFSKWKSICPIKLPQLPKDQPPASDEELRHLPVNSYLAESFEVSNRFFTDGQIWGCDYITLALLAVAIRRWIRSLLRQVAISESLRDSWFQFVSSDDVFSNLRPWTEWWDSRKLTVPVELPNASVYLLTWDPKRTPDAVKRIMAELQHGNQGTVQWSVGNHGIKRGDRIFFMRQGDDRPGLIGAGFVMSDIRRGRHWDETAPPDWMSYYANILWDVLQELPLISLSDLVTNTRETRLWTKQGSGLPIPPKLVSSLESLWTEALRAQAQHTVSSSAVSQQVPSTASPAATGSQEFAAAPAQQAPPSVTATPQPSALPSPPPAPEASSTRLPDTWMLSDRPLEAHFREQDRFQFEDYANALAAVLDHPKTETPLTMAIHAPWSAGKTTLANMIAEQLQQSPRDRGRSHHLLVQRVDAR